MSAKLTDFDQTIYPIDASVQDFPLTVRYQDIAALYQDIKISITAQVSNDKVSQWATLVIYMNGSIIKWISQKSNIVEMNYTQEVNKIEAEFMGGRVYYANDPDTGELLVKIEKLQLPPGATSEIRVHYASYQNNQDITGQILEYEGNNMARFTKPAIIRGNDENF